MEDGKKPSKKKKLITGNAIRMIVFLCIIAFISFVCITVFDFDDPERSNETVDQFYALEDDTVDCVMIGASVTQRDYVVPVGFHDDGVAAYSLACGAQPFVMAKYLMKEALKTQDPKVFVIELKGSCRGPAGISEYGFRKMVDNMKPSINRFWTIKDIVEYSSGYKNGVDDTGLSYYLPFFKYHSLWNPSNRPKHNGMDYYKGYAVAPNISFKVRGINQIPVPEEKKAIAPETEEFLNELMDYSDTIDAEVLFIISPYGASYEAMKKMNYTKPLIEARGYKVLDFRTRESREAIGLNDGYCFYNREHLNYYGSLIFTDWFAKYLKDEYDLPDRRGDEKYAAWEEEYQRLQTNLKTGIYAEKYDKMMGEIEDREKEESQQ